MLRQSEPHSDTVHEQRRRLFSDHVDIALLIKIVVAGIAYLVYFAEREFLPESRERGYHGEMAGAYPGGKGIADEEIAYEHSEMVSPHGIDRIDTSSQ